MSGDKHDAACRRRNLQFLCTCGLPNSAIVEILGRGNLIAPGAVIGNPVAGTVIALAAAKAGEAVTIDLETPTQAAERILREDE